MKSLYLDETGDLVINELNSFKMIAEDDEVRQRNRLKIGTNREDWFLDLKFGLPWISKENGLLGKSTGEEIKQAVLEYLLADDAIEAIQTINLKSDEQKRLISLYIEGTLTNGNDFKQEVEVS